MRPRAVIEKAACLGINQQLFVKLTAALPRSSDAQAPWKGTSSMEAEATLNGKYCLAR